MAPQKKIPDGKKGGRIFFPILANREDVEDLFRDVGENEIFEGQISHHLDLGRRKRRGGRRGKGSKLKRL